MDDHRRHYSFHWDQVCEALGIKGEAIRMWSELDADYLHVLTLDPTAKATLRGGYVEIESPMTETHTSTGEPNG